ncbi:hypothetical protein [Saccharothrix carnea]|uniref:hypothetical protein n=1 Tax=Saccharothrix carnea TaxID=1280637 RepID=UPI0011B29DAB|nr:hypothetical protein [Saccharothrix carnea]
MSDLVEESRPRLFALVREFGEYRDAEVGAWGMAWSDRVRVVSAAGDRWVSFRSPERAARLFGVDGEAARLVWVDRPVDRPAEP